MNMQKISLNGNDWQICQDDRGPHLAWAEGWLPATVPGNIQGDLQDDRLLKPLRYGMGDDRLMAVCLTGWWYRKVFTLPAIEPGQRVAISFGSVDYSSTVYLNGQKIACTEGQFNRFIFDVTDAVKAGENELKVLIDPMPEELAEWLEKCDGALSGEGTDYHFVTVNDMIRRRLKGLKSPGTCSYDWAFNMYTLGIWKDVDVLITGAARIDWLCLRGPLSDNYTKGSIDVLLETDSVSAIEGACRLTVTAPDGGVSVHTIPCTIPAGQGTVTVSVPVENPALWWPNGYGEHPLYTVQAELLDGDTVMAAETDRMGFRDIDWEFTEGAPEGFKDKFGLLVNGKRVRTLGSCLLIPDLLAGRVGDRGCHFVEMARACHMTALREHGGQAIMPKSLYDSCDENGIIILMDFPMGNCIPENEPVFLKNLEFTIANIVRQLRNHPCIADWSGGNELNVYFNKDADRTALDLMHAVVKREDPTRVMRDTCPINGSRHAPWDYIPDRHYAYWNTNLTDNFGKIPVMRYGEFGCQTPANLEEWLRDIPKASRWPLNEQDPVLIRKNVFGAAFAQEYWLLPDVLTGVFGPLEDVEMTIWAGQYLAAEGIRYAMDAMRAMGKRLGGFSSWDYNEPWPNGAGSYVIDYDGNPVMAYYYVQQALAPLALQLKYDHINIEFFKESFAELRLVSDMPETVEGLTWSYVCRDRIGRVYAQDSGTVSIDPLEVKSLVTFKLNPPENMQYGPIFTELCLKDAAGNIVAERLYVFGTKGVKNPLRAMLRPEQTTVYEWGVPYALTGVAGGKISATKLTVADVAFSEADGWETLAITLHNDGDMTALLPELHPLLKYRTDLFIENNFSFVPPHESRVITVRARKASLSLSQLGWWIDCRNAEKIVLPPDEAVLLYMGREDATAHAYADAGSAAVTAADRSVDPAAMPRLIRGEASIAFTAAEGAAELQLAFADTAAQTKLTVAVNGTAYPLVITDGLGIQESDPEHLAYPHCATLAIPAGVLKAEENTLTFTVEEGWFTWDALCLVKRA